MLLEKAQKNDDKTEDHQYLSYSRRITRKEEIWEVGEKRRENVIEARRSETLKK